MGFSGENKERRKTEKKSIEYLLKRRTLKFGEGVQWLKQVSTLEKLGVLL